MNIYVGSLHFKMNEAEAKKAIEELNGAEVQGRNIIVNESIERTDRRRDFRGGNDRRGGDGPRRDNR